MRRRNHPATAREPAPRRSDYHGDATRLCGLLDSQKRLPAPMHTSARPQAAIYAYPQAPHRERTTTTLASSHTRLLTLIQRTRSAPPAWAEPCPPRRVAKDAFQQRSPSFNAQPFSSPARLPVAIARAARHQLVRQHYRGAVTPGNGQRARRTSAQSYGHNEGGAKKGAPPRCLLPGPISVPIRRTFSGKERGAWSEPTE